MGNLLVYFPYLIVALIGLVLGVLVGVLIGSVFNPSKSSRRSRDRNLAEVLTIWRNRSNAVILLEIAGKTYKSTGELSEKQRNGLTRLLDHLHMWLGVPDLETRTSMQTSSKPPDKIESLEHLPQVQLDETPFDNFEQSASSEPLSTPLPAITSKMVTINNLEPAQEVKPPTMVDIISRAVRGEKPPELTVPKSIPEQINEIVQERLPRSPLQGHSLRITELPERGLVVLADGKQYDGVSDVDDPEIRAFLQQCVAEWEQGL